MNPDQRLKQLQDLLAQEPNDPFLHYALAQEYLKRGEAAAAREKFQLLLDEHPTYVGTYYHFGKLEESENQPERAVKCYEAGLQQAQAQNDDHSARELQEALNLCKNLFDLDDEDWD
jgi:Uncharacterized enzyme of heme biosynthesis